MDMAFMLDVVVAFLLVVTVGYCWQLNRRLNNLRKGREELAALADGKLERAQRIPVLLDTTVCRTFEAETAEDATAARDGMRGRLGLLTVKQLVRRVLEGFDGKSARCAHHDNREAIEAGMCEFLGIRVPYHPAQLHLAEYCAHMMRDIVTNSDLLAEAKHMRSEKAQSSDGPVVADAAADSDAGSEAGEVEDVGGATALDDAEDAAEEIGADGFAYKIALDTREACQLLERHFELEEPKKPGRNKEAHKDMEKYLDAFGSLLEETRATAREQAGRGGLEGGMCFADPGGAKREQARRAKELVEAAEQREEESSVGRARPYEPQQAQAALVDLDGLLGSPRDVAWRLLREAGANEEQVLATALVALPLERAWQERRHSEESENLEMPLDQAIFRGVFVGGGGCGKTHVINKIVKPLLRRFYGDACCMTVAPSNKAARLVEGRTLHAAFGLAAAATFKTSRLKPQGKTAKTLECRFARVAALVLARVITIEGDVRAVLRNVKTIALSVDSADSHKGWIGDINETQNTTVDYPILADEDGDGIGDACDTA